jgi:hypothetical protein
MPGRRTEGLAQCQGCRLRQRHQTEPVDYALSPLGVAGRQHTLSEGAGHEAAQRSRRAPLEQLEA